MASECLTGLGISGVFKVVVTDRELSVWFLYVWVVHNTDVTTSKNRSFVGVAGDRKLGQVEVELLSEVDWEDEGCHAFVGCPMFLCRIPGERSVPSNNFAVLCLEDSDCISDVVASFMEFCDWKSIFTCTIKKIHGFNIRFGEKRSYVVMLFGNSAVESWNLTVIHRDVGGNWHLIFFSLGHIEIFDAVNRKLYILECLSALICWKVGL